MSQSCIVPDWNLRNQRQLLVQEIAFEVAEEEQAVNIATPHVQTQLHHHHHHHHQNHTPTLVPMPNYEVAELTWENGQLAMHGLGGILPSMAAQTSKPTWGRTGDTLESIVHQATCHNQAPKNNLLQQQNDNLNVGNMCSTVASSSGKWGDSSGHVQAAPSFLKKRVRSASNRNIPQERPDISACASVSATISKDNETTMMTWPSFESPNWSLKSKTTDDDASENQEEECKNKGETVRSHSTRRSRAAAVHNQSERRRRDRINQKMKALQKLVPNASKTDKASMLDEVIEYLKNLQATVQMMNTVRNMPQMMMPLQQMQQQQLQMSMLARMAGMGVGLGMGMGIMPQSLPASALIPQNHVPSTTTTPTFVPPQFVMPQMIPGHAASQVRHSAPAANAPVSFSDPYSSFLAQSMNMDLYNKMATLYRQQVSQAAKSMASPSRSKGE